MASVTELRFPDITPNTHIVGLCGVCDWKFPNSGLKRLTLLETDGCGKTQAWWSCLDPEELVIRHGEYLQGNCFRERRVVLDQSQKPDRTTVFIVHITPPKELLCQFLQYFQQLCGRACNAEEPILLYVFFLGDRDTYDFEDCWGGGRGSFAIGGGDL